MKLNRQRLQELAGINKSLNEGRPSVVLDLIARNVAKIIGSKLEPAEFYENLHDYFKDGINGEYGLDHEDMLHIEDAWAEIQQEGLLQVNINTSEVRDSEMYKQYIKY
tara:strand:+ start:549 stop:872 length:324 start_codon:yes stop_codon:yes gene_type:complete